MAKKKRQKPQAEIISIDSIRFKKALKEAEQIWLKISKAAYKKYGDTGSCTLGGGITMDLIPPGKRKPQRVVVLYSPSNVQGEVVKFAGMKEAAEYLYDLGFKVGIDYGMVD